MFYLDDCLKLIKEFEQRQLIKKNRKKLVNKSVAERRDRKSLTATIFRSIDVFIAPSLSIIVDISNEKQIDDSINSQTVVVDVEKQTITATTISAIDNESIKRRREKSKKMIIKN